MRRYLLILLGLSLVATVCVAAFTRVMDPFGVYGRAVTNRPAKVEAITRAECRVVALGSSRTELGVDTRWDIWENIGPACNVGLGALEVTEMTAGFDYIAEETSVEKLVVMVDFFQFDDARQPPVVAHDTRFLKRNSALYHLNGMLSRRFVEGAWDQWEIDREGRTKILSVNGFPVGLIIGRGLPSDERFSRSLSTGLAGFEQLVPSAAKGDVFAKGLEDVVVAGLDVTVIINPMHALHLELIDRTGLWDEFEDWKAQVASTVSDINERLGSSMPVWDYARYVGAPLERVIPGEGIFSWQDSSHYTAKVGRIIISDALGLGAVDDDVAIEGVELTSIDVQEHLAAERSMRDDYRTNNPDQIAFLDTVLAEE